MDSFVIKSGVVLMFFLLVGPFFFAYCEDQKKQESRLKFCEKFSQSIEAYNQCVEKKK